MTPKDLLIERLTTLCATHGGVEAVAETAEISLENLKQILAGRLLPSGERRGVGPTLQRKLEAVYPGWASASMPKAQEALPHEIASPPVQAPLATWPFGSAVSPGEWQDWLIISGPVGAAERLVDRFRGMSAGQVTAEAIGKPSRSNSA